MTYDEIFQIAKRLDKEVQQEIDKEVEERLEILAQGELNDEELAKMEEYLYMSFIIQEVLDGEYDLLEEEKVLLLEDMEDLYKEYGSLLAKAKLEQKITKKKMMTLELMRIREQLFKRRDRVKDVDDRIKENRDNSGQLVNLSNKEGMKKIVADTKKDKAQQKINNKEKKDLSTLKNAQESIKATSNNIVQKERKVEVLKKEPSNISKVVVSVTRQIEQQRNAIAPSGPMITNESSLSGRMKNKL